MDNKSLSLRRTPSTANSSSNSMSIFQRVASASSAASDVFSQASLRLRLGQDDDEESLKWAALEKLPTYARMKKGFFLDQEIDIDSLGVAQKRHLLERLARVADEDNECFLLKLKQRIDRSRKKSRKHAEQPLAPLPPKTRQELTDDISDARDDNEGEISDSCTSDMTMSPFSDLFTRSMSMTESAESTSSRSLLSVFKPSTEPLSPDNVLLRKSERAYTETPDTMSEATTESEGESEISSYYVSLPPPPTYLVQPQNGAVRRYGSLLAAVSLIASLVRLMLCGETCALLLTSSTAFLVIMWGPMLKYSVPMWNKERYRIKSQRRPTHAEMRGNNSVGARMAHATP